ncbi:MAG TPA: Smr/MutS family protein [Lysobacter sp.]|jgi:DNA-nicking Smr family endonuclease|nr:Smr/MutS family protein [Lysobacter sp.]
MARKTHEGSPPGERPAGSEAPDDAALFRDAIGPVREIPAQNAPPAKPRPRPTPRMGLRDEAEATSEFRRALTVDALEAGDALSYRRDNLPPRTLQRLKRGHFAAQDELDLHWADARQAEAMLREFLHHARQQGLGCVRVIHGKGLHGDSQAPVLKNLVDRQLRHRADVLAFASAPSNQGGTGAVLVLLAQKR